MLLVARSQCRLGKLPASEGQLTQEWSNSAGSPQQPATAIYPLSNETNYFYCESRCRQYACCSCRPIEYGCERRGRREVGNPPEILQQAVMYTLSLYPQRPLCETGLKDTQRLIVIIYWIFILILLFTYLLMSKHFWNCS